MPSPSPKTPKGTKHFGTTYQSGAEGLFLVCAELTRRGYIVSPTLRNARGADILATSMDCTRAFAVQVKTATKATDDFWLVDKPDAPCSDSLVYVLVNLNGHAAPPSYYVVPSRELREGTRVDKGGGWAHFRRDERYRDGWAVFEASGQGGRA